MPSSLKSLISWTLFLCSNVFIGFAFGCAFHDPYGMRGLPLVGMAQLFAVLVIIRWFVYGNPPELPVSEMDYYS